MTVRVDFSDTDLSVWHMWADTSAELADFSARLGAPTPSGLVVLLPSDVLWRRAILMGAIPSRPAVDASRGIQ